MDKRRVGIKAVKVAFLAVVMSVAATTTSYAGPLNIVLDSTPKIQLQNNILSRWDDGVFTADGWAVGWDSGSGNNVINYTFHLEARNITLVNGVGVATTTLLIGSESAPFVSASGITQIGVAGKTIEFLFDTFGGSQGVFSSGAPLDVQITVGSFPVVTVQFTNPANEWFNSNGSGVLRQPDAPDAVPEPSTLLALVAGAGGLLARRRRARAAKTIA